MNAHEALPREVIKLRYFQHLVNERLKKGSGWKIPVHLAIGHEAIAVAISTAMTKDDKLVLSHRNIAYNLAREGQLAPILAEFDQKPTGLAGGQLGSMNLANPGKGIVYTSSILGNNFAVATGVALGHSVRGLGQSATFVLTGDGAMEEGGFYEALVFARSHKLALIIVVENNDQSMASTIDERRCPIDIGAMCKTVNAPFVSLSGGDVHHYAKTIAAVRTQATVEHTVACVEVMLPHFNRHAGPTPGWQGDTWNIALENGLIVERNEMDPLFVLERSLGPEAFAALCKDVVQQLEA